MSPNLLILGGTTEATTFANAAAERGLQGTVSFAGRVDRPKRQPLPQRMGGFGGAEGLAAFLAAERITHVIDATHPFAARMSRNAVAACAAANTPLIALTRAPWIAQDGDAWTHVPDTASAVAALDRPACRVMLAVGRMTLDDFAPNGQHFYLLRLVDPPKRPPPFARFHVEVSRGPFTAEADLALIEHHGIDLIVSKNAGGRGAYAKIAAARTLGLPVIMIDRPKAPDRREAHEVYEVLDWIGHPTDLGV